MRTFSFFLTFVAAMIVSGGTFERAAPANVIRVAGAVCGSNGCYVPQTQAVRPRPLQPLGQPVQPINRPMGQPLTHG